MSKLVVVVEIEMIFAIIDYFGMKWILTNMNQLWTDNISTTHIDIVYVIFVYLN